MFCSNCGNQLPNNISFCSNCGTPVKITAPAVQPSIPDIVTAPVPAPIPSVYVPNETEITPETFTDVINSVNTDNSESSITPESKMDFADSVFPKQSTAGMPNASATPNTSDMPLANNGNNTPASEPVLQEHVKNTPVKEKAFFGKGAMAFCIFLIIILSVTAGVFAALYLNEIGFSFNLW